MQNLPLMRKGDAGIVSRYDVEGAEGEYQPGSGRGVLRNSLNLTNPLDVSEAETELLSVLYQKVFSEFPDALPLHVLFDWHRWWLGNLYAWAGKIRSVFMSKPDISFAAPLQIQRLLPLDYRLWDEHKAYYFKAIQAGRDGDLSHIERLVRDVLEKQEPD